MNNKCSKYQEFFIFQDKETLEQHLQECEECRAEQETMDKVSSLLDEVKMYYYEKRKKRMVRLRAACAVVFMMFSILSITMAVTNDDLMDTLKYGDTLTAEELGFPVDSDGLLMVDDE